MNKFFCIAMVCFSAAVGKSFAAPVENEAYLTNITFELQKKWPANRTINIVCHGHSVPAGYF